MVEQVQPRDVTRDQVPRVKILVAEDSAVNRLIIGKMLASIGVDMEFAANGRIAYEMASCCRYDLILMDITMPEMDGMDATKAIRAHELSNAQKAIPIVALSAHSQDRHMDLALAAGLDEYLVKPIDVSTLRELLARWVIPNQMG